MSARGAISSGPGPGGMGASSEAALGLWLRLVDLQIPRRLRSDPDLLSRLRIGVSLVYTVLPLTALFAALGPPSFRGPHGALFTWLYAGIVPWVWICLGIGRRSGSFGFALHLGIGYFALFWTLLIHESGGPLSPATVWLVTLPMAAALPLGRGAGLAWLGFVLGVHAAGYGLHVAGYAFPPIPSTEKARSWLLNTNATMLFLVAMILATERARARASETLEQTNAALAQARERADAANREKSEFVANVSHELRTPMNAVLGFTDLALERYEQNLADPEDADALRTIARNAGTLLEILDDVLDLSRIEAQRLEIRIATVELRPLIDRIVGLMHRQASEKGISLVVEYRDPMPETLETDPLRLQQILLNLIANAIKFSFEGEVRVCIALAAGGEGERLGFEVSDSGIGMTAEQMERIFRPFAQADPSTTRLYGGTGLGLSISRQLAQLLGGTIGVRSVPGVGSTFHVELPVCREAQGARPEVPADPGPSAAPRCPGVRVLVVDDTADNRRLAQHILERAGARVDASPSGEDALERVRLAQAEGGYDVILMDIQMPRMDGYAALQALRRSGCVTPVIAFTAHAMTSEREQALAAGFARHAPKPLERHALVRLVAETVAERSTQKRDGEPSPTEAATVRTVRPQLGERLARAMIAPPQRQVPDAIREARAAIWMSAIALAFLPLMAALTWWVLPRPTATLLAGLILGLAPVIVGTLILDRVCGLRHLSTHGVCLYVLGLLAAFVYMSGGPGAPSAAWGVLMPMTAVALLGSRAAVFWALAFIAMNSAFYVASLHGAPFHDHIAPASRALAETASYAALSVVVTAFGLVHQRAKIEASERLAAANLGLRAARAQAERGERAKAEFLASISHELRTPMTAMLGFADMLEERWRLRGVAQADLDLLWTVQQNARRLLDLVNDLLDLARIDAGHLQLERVSFCPATLIAATAANLAGRASERGLRLDCGLDAPLPARIDGDPTRLRQILVKLLSNAIKFTEAGGVRLRAGVSEREGQRWLDFRVEDTGRGIPEEQLPHLFLPFHQGDSSASREHGGTGMGLALCQRLVHAMGGRIEVTSQVGHGSSFRVEIPIAFGPDDATVSALPAQEAAGEGEPQRLLGWRLLLAEDSADNRRLISHMLERAGAEVDVAENGRIALDRALAADSAGAPYDLIVMDVEMPVMDGREATRALRAAGHTGPIVALTAHVESEERRRCLAAGCDDVAQKPVDWEALFATLRALLPDAKPPAR